jgi:hypothetical protein
MAESPLAVDSPGKFVSAMESDWDTAGAAETASTESETLRQVLKAIFAVSKRQTLDVSSWNIESKDENSLSGEDVITPNAATVTRLQQFALYCARQGMLNEVKYAYSSFLSSVDPAFRFWVLEAIPANVSPAEFVELLPTTTVARSVGNLEWPSSLADALVRGWNEEMIDGPYHIAIPPPYQEASSGYVMDESTLRRWYLSTAMRYDSLGFSYHAYVLLSEYFAERGDSIGALEEKSDDTDYLRELHTQLYHYCHCVYDNIIPEDTTLIDWMATPLQDQVKLVVKHNFDGDSTSPMTLQEVLGGYLVPMWQGDRAVQCTWAQLALFLQQWDACAKCTLEYARRFGVLCRNTEMSADPTALEGTAEEWPTRLAQALVATVAPLDLASLRRVAEVAVASKPTLPSEERRLPSNAALVEMVVGACYQYDDVHSGLEVMWQLVECTPTREALSEETALDASMALLDTLERALNTSELLRVYMPVPALSVMIPPAEVQLAPTLGHSASIGGGNKLKRFRYKQQLLEGCSFLFDRVESALRAQESEEDREREDDDSDAVKPAYLQERVDRRVKFGQTVVMRLCHDFGEKLEAAKRDGSMSVLVSHTWLKLATDLAELSRVSVFRSEVSLEWVGQILFACLLHFRSTELKAVLTHVCNVEGPPASPKKELSATLATVFGLTAETAQALVLDHAMVLTNSVASCCDPQAQEDLKNARDLLRLVPEDVRSHGTIMELRLHEFLNLLDAIELDFIPLQLRVPSPLEVARKVLSERPDAYYTLVQANQRESAEELDDTSEHSAPAPTLSRTKRAVNTLKARPIPGQGFVQLLLGLSATHSRDAEDAGSEATLLVDTLRVISLLAGAALAVGNTEHAYCYCNYLLDEYRFNSADVELQNEIVGVTSLVMEALTNREYMADAEIGPALRDDILCSIAATTSVEQFDRLSHLWRSTEPLPAFTDSLLHDVVPDKLNPLDTAKVLLYEGMAVLLKRDRHTSGSMHRALEESTVSLVMEEALCYLSQVPDPEAAVALLESTLSDIRRKLTMVQRMQGASSDRYVGYEAPPDEKMIEHLVQKGFPRNGAKRAVLHTQGHSLNAALAWAIEHSGDADFDHPVAQQVRGAILTQEASREENSLRNLRDALQLIEDVSTTYRVHAGLPERIPPPVPEERTDSRPNSALSDLVAAESTAASSPAALSTAAATPERPSRKAVPRPERPTQGRSKKPVKQSLGARRIVDDGDGIATTAAATLGDDVNHELALSSAPLSLGTDPADGGSDKTLPGSVASELIDIVSDPRTDLMHLSAEPTLRDFVPDRRVPESRVPPAPADPLDELNAMLDDDTFGDDAHSRNLAGQSAGEEESSSLPEDPSAQGVVHGNTPAHHNGGVADWADGSLAALDVSADSIAADTAPSTYGAHTLSSVDGAATDQTVFPSVGKSSAGWDDYSLTSFNVSQDADDGEGESERRGASSVGLPVDGVGAYVTREERDEAPGSPDVKEGASHFLTRGASPTGGWADGCLADLDLSADSNAEDAAPSTYGDQPRSVHASEASMVQSSVDGVATDQTVFPSVGKSSVSWDDYSLDSLNMSQHVGDGQGESDRRTGLPVEETEPHVTGGRGGGSHIEAPTFPGVIKDASHFHAESASAIGGSADWADEPLADLDVFADSNAADTAPSTLGAHASEASIVQQSVDGAATDQTVFPSVGQSSVTWDDYSLDSQDVGDNQGADQRWDGVASAGPLGDEAEAAERYGATGDGDGLPAAVMGERELEGAVVDALEEQDDNAKPTPDADIGTANTGGTTDDSARGHAEAELADVDQLVRVDFGPPALSVHSGAGWAADSLDSADLNQDDIAAPGLSDRSPPVQERSSSEIAAGDMTFAGDNLNAPGEARDDEANVEQDTLVVASTGWEGHSLDSLSEESVPHAEIQGEPTVSERVPERSAEPRDSVEQHGGLDSNSPHSSVTSVDALREALAADSPTGTPQETRYTPVSPRQELGAEETSAQPAAAEATAAWDDSIDDLDLADEHETSGDRAGRGADEPRFAEDGEAPNQSLLAGAEGNRADSYAAPISPPHSYQAAVADVVGGGPAAWGDSIDDLDLVDDEGVYLRDGGVDGLGGQNHNIRESPTQSVRHQEGIAEDGGAADFTGPGDAAAPSQPASDVGHTAANTGWDDASLGSLASEEAEGVTSFPVPEPAVLAHGQFDRETLAADAAVSERSAIAEALLSAPADLPKAAGSAWDEASLGELDLSGEHDQPQSFAAAGAEYEVGSSAKPRREAASSDAAAVEGWEEPSFGSPDEEGDNGDETAGHAVAVVAADEHAVVAGAEDTLAHPAASAWDDAELDDLDVDAIDDVAPASTVAAGDSSLEEREAEVTAVIESALEVAAEVLALNAATFNATKVAMHIAAFDPALHAAASSSGKSSVQLGPVTMSGNATEEENDAAGDDTWQSVVAVYHMCRALATSDRREAFSVLLQLLSAIPYSRFHAWLAERIERIDLRVHSTAVLSSASLTPQQASIWCATALTFTHLFTGNEDGAHLKVYLWPNPLK